MEQRTGTEGANGIEDISSTEKSEGSSTKAADESSSSATKPIPSSKDVSPARPDPAASTTSSRITPVNGQGTGAALNMPHPKKFSHIDINKRFLEKNSAASSTGHTSSPSIANKPGSALRALHYLSCNVMSG